MSRLGSFGVTDFQLDAQPVLFEVFTSWVDRILDPHDASHLIQFLELYPENWMRWTLFKLVKLKKYSQMVGSEIETGLCKLSQLVIWQIFLYSSSIV